MFAIRWAVRAYYILRYTTLSDQKGKCLLVGVKENADCIEEVSQKRLNPQLLVPVRGRTKYSYLKSPI